ncbi:MAG: glycosyltransferase [Thermoleophilaceae bacterium]|nr:glycosyltransferase [Thermoleophilaceae bacterium]
MAGRIRVLRAIARLNMGGPAYHVSLLSGLLDPERYETLLVSGRVGPGEEELADVAARYGARHEYIEHLGPEIDPRRDLRALREMTRIARDFEPHVVHTHTAKAGMVGRTAALALRPRPVVIHTYHGHVLEGYFGPARNALYRSIERALGLGSDALVGVSTRTVEDLVRLRIAPRRKFRAIPLGLDLDPFTRPDPGARERLRARLGVGEEEVLLQFTGRLVPIKRVDVALRALAAARAKGTAARLAIVGDGELRAELEALAAQLGLGEAVSFLGYRSDLVDLTAASDAALLTSANEGTPVALIEASAAGRPSVATDVGGVREVVTGETGVVVAEGDVDALAAGIARLAESPEERERMGAAAREHALGRYSVKRLLADVDALYGELRATRRGLG